MSSLWQQQQGEDQHDSKVHRSWSLSQLAPADGALLNLLRLPRRLPRLPTLQQAHSRLCLIGLMSVLPHVPEECMALRGLGTESKCASALLQQ